MGIFCVSGEIHDVHFKEAPSDRFQVKQLGIVGAFLIECKTYSDQRGEFARHYAKGEMPLPKDFRVVHANVSRTSFRGTFRGMHYQVPPFAESKLISCLSGAILEVFTDLRPDSPTFLESVSQQLDSNSLNLLFVPKGVANGYLTLSDDALVHYYASAAYSRSHEYGFRYDDQILPEGFIAKPKLVSEKDEGWEPLRLDELSVLSNLL